MISAHSVMSRKKTVLLLQDKTSKNEENLVRLTISAKVIDRLAHNA